MNSVFHTLVYVEINDRLMSGEYTESHQMAVCNQIIWLYYYKGYTLVPIPMKDISIVTLDLPL